MKFLTLMTKSCIFLMLLSFSGGQLLAQSHYFLLRHAEKQLGVGKDPNLTTEGHARAERIAQLLKNSQVDKIYSTNYQRTLQTAKPLSELSGIEIEIYDPRKLKQFAETLKTQEGTFVIVGHSNTTPKLTALLGEKPMPFISETDYGALYLVTRQQDKATVLEFSTDQ